MSEEQGPDPAAPAAEATAKSPPPKSTTKIIVIAIVAILVIVAAGVGAWLIWGGDEATPEATVTGGELQTVALRRPAPETKDAKTADTLGALSVQDVEPSVGTSPEPSPESADSYTFVATADSDFQVRIGPGAMITYIGPDGEWEIADWQETEDGGLVHFWTDDELAKLNLPEVAGIGAPTDGTVSEAYVVFYLDDQGTLSETCVIVVDGENYGWENTYTFVDPNQSW
jgi:hypothetical protein